jgi:hypothetical protein
MGRIYRSDRPVTVYHKSSEDTLQGVTLPIRTRTGEQFPRMSRRERREMERETRRLVEKQKQTNGDL